MLHDQLIVRIVCHILHFQVVIFDKMQFYYIYGRSIYIYICKQRNKMKLYNKNVKVVRFNI